MLLLLPLLLLHTQNALGQQIIREGELNSLDQTMGLYVNTQDYFKRRLRLNLHKSLYSGALRCVRELRASGLAVPAICRYASGPKAV